MHIKLPHQQLWRLWRWSEADLKGLKMKVWTSPRHPGRRDSHGPGRHRTADQRSLNRPGRTWPDCANWETTRRQLSSSEVVWDPRPINWNHIWNHMSWGKFGRSKMFLKFCCIMCLCLSQVAFCTETWLSLDKSLRILHRHWWSSCPSEHWHFKKKAVIGYVIMTYHDYPPASAHPILWMLYWMLKTSLESIHLSFTVMKSGMYFGDFWGKYPLHLLRNRKERHSVTSRCAPDWLVVQSTPAVLRCDRRPVEKGPEKHKQNMWGICTIMHIAYVTEYLRISSIRIVFVHSSLSVDMRALWRKSAHAKSVSDSTPRWHLRRIHKVGCRNQPQIDRFR
jgi:hypothetical protein